MTNIDSYGNIKSHEYTYIITDLRNNAILAEVPLRGVTYSNVLSGIGDASGSISINDETKKYRLWQNALAGKTGLYIFRDNRLMWGGIIWKRRYEKRSSSFRIAAKTFESYFFKRFQDTTKFHDQADQLDIARWLLEHNDIAADLLIDVSDATSPRRRDRTMFGYEYKTAGEELSQLAALNDGFDWNVTSYLDTEGIIRRRLDLFYPFAGVSKDKSLLVFEYPGPIKDFSIEEDAESSGNVVTALGVGEGTEMVTVTVEDRVQLDQGWPRLELSRSYKSVTYPSTLLAHAEADLNRLRTPITIFDVDVDPDIEPQYGAYSLGDWARFRIEDDFLGTTFDSFARITSIEVSIDDGTGLEKVSLTLGGEKEPQDDQPPVQ